MTTEAPTLPRTTLRRIKEITRFWSRIDKSGDCWLWTGPVGREGYARFHPRRNLNLSVHRTAYALVKGPVPRGYNILHVCHERDETCAGGPTCLHRRCANPAHLEPASPQVTSLRHQVLRALATDKQRWPPHGHLGQPPIERRRTARAVNATRLSDV